jgi:ABC-type transport system involved in multi-copper enzyme maturation permease subunit
MSAALLYKEYREHRSIWLALAMLGVGLLVGLPQVVDPQGIHQLESRDLLGATAVILAWTYGVVCGAMLFAGEKEAGTQRFLDTLPISRRSLWWGKCRVGLLFLALQLALLAGLAGAQGFYPAQYPLAACAVVLVLAGLVGYGWGLLFSATSSSVLEAIGLALLAQFSLVPVAYFLVLLPLAMAVFLLRVPFAELVAVLLATLVILPAPFLLSALLYSRADRTRRPVRAAPRIRETIGWAGWRQTAWLERRQVRGLLLGLAVFSLAAGLPVSAAGLIAWPVLTLALGTFCGVTVFLDEQGGAYRFLGEQRFPLGRIWLVKAAMRFGVLLICLVLLLLPATIALIVQRVNNPADREYHSFLGAIMGSHLLDFVIPPGLFLFLWPVYGFACGHVCGMLFRKPLVALVVGFGVTVLLAGVWAPSMLLGGLHVWQVAGPPLVLLICSRFLMYVWSSDRLLSWATAGRVAVAVVVAAGLVGLGLWSRIQEIPDATVPEGFSAFVASLPTPEENEAGQLIRGACSQVADLEKRWVEMRPTKPLFPNDPRGAEGSFLIQLGEVLERGWPDGKPELAGLLDEAFAANWPKRLQEASTKPVGVVEDPRRLTVFGPERYLQPALTASRLLAVRGLQVQKMDNDPAVFIDHFTAGMALGRTLWNHSTTRSARAGWSVQSQQLDGLDRWLEQLRGRPELLRRVAVVIRRQRESMPADLEDQRFADYLVALNSLDQPEEWLRRVVDRAGEKPADQLGLVELAWHAPWEQARQRRLVRALNWDGLFFEIGRRRWPLAPVFDSAWFARTKQQLTEQKADLAAAELVVALRCFQADTGRPAARLSELAPKYLERIPADPFDGQPFRYRLSQGEEILGQTGVKAKAGQGILWSVGPDRTDNGGRVQGRHRNAPPGADLIYLVPLPARP